MTILKRKYQKLHAILALTMFIFLSGCNESGQEPQNVIEKDNDEPTEVFSEQNDDEVAEREKLLKEMTTEDWEVETVAENLHVPWSLNIYNEKYYMTDRGGQILEVDNGEVIKSELQTSNPIAHEGEGGLLGFILSNDFDDTKEGFAYYTYRTSDNDLQNRVVLIEFDEENGWSETGILLDDILGAPKHNGGRIALGPDDMLYVTTGDADVPELAQDKDHLAGSILRMTTSGEVPEDNPFEGSYVYSYGHRNPQGLAWNDSGELYSSEHGAEGLDEINLIEPGKNYGWPEIEGDETAEDMEGPLIHSGEETWAPSGIAFWEDQLLVTGLRGQSLYVYDEEEDDMSVIYGGEGRLRDVKVDGEVIYLITNNTDGRGTPKENDDRLLKLTKRE